MPPTHLSFPLFLILLVPFLAGCMSEQAASPPLGPTVILHQTRIAGGAWVDERASGGTVLAGQRGATPTHAAATGPTSAFGRIQTQAASELGYGASAAPLPQAPAGSLGAGARAAPARGGFDPSGGGGASPEGARPTPPAYVPPAEAGVAPDRSRIVESIIAQSRASYAGSCPCPDNRDSARRRCGGRSAYSRAGGDAPLCYASDVTDAMVAAFR